MPLYIPPHIPTESPIEPFNRPISLSAALPYDLIEQAVCGDDHQAATTVIPAYAATVTYIFLSNLSIKQIQQWMKRNEERSKNVDKRDMKNDSTKAAEPDESPERAIPALSSVSQ